MGVNQYQHPVCTHRLQSDGTHEQPAQHAALHVHGVGRHLVDIGGVDHVGMNNKCVAYGTQQLRGRRRITGVAPDGGPDPGWYQHGDVEAPRVLRTAFAESHRQPGWQAVGIAASLERGSLAFVR